MNFGFFPQLDCDAVAHDRGVIISSLIMGVEPENSIAGRFPGFKDLPPAQTGREIPMDSSPEEFVSDLKQFAAAGVGGVILSAYGLIPPGCFETVKKAFRYALREAR